MISDEQYAQLDAYLFGQMGTDDRTAFEAVLVNNEELAQALRQVKMEHAAMKIAMEEDLRAQMKNWQENLNQQNKEDKPKVSFLTKHRRILLWVMSSAASVLLVIGFLTQRWASRNYSDAALLIIWNADSKTRTIRGHSEPSSGPLKIDTIKAENLEQVLQQLNMIDTVTYENELLKAGIYYRLAQYANASKHLQIALANTKEIYHQDDIHWRLAMLDLAEGHYEKAKTKLVEIAKDDGNFRQPHAKETLAKLNSFWRKLI